MRSRYWICQQEHRGVKIIELPCVNETPDLSTKIKQRSFCYTVISVYAPTLDRSKDAKLTWNIKENSLWGFQVLTRLFSQEI